MFELPKYEGEKFEKGSLSKVKDYLTIEEALQININQEPFTVIMRSPGQEEDMVRGLLHNEDIYLIILALVFSIIFYFVNDINLLSVFTNVLSSIANSGISTSAVPENFGLYFIILTLIGGSVVSTTSGLKFLRIYILIKAFLMEIYRLVKPNLVLNTKIMFSENKINSDNIRMSFLIFISFFISLFILSSILLLDFLDFENSFKLYILTLTNTVASNIYGMETINFSGLFTFSKVSLIIFMVIAKVELLAIFILAQKIFLKN